MQIILRGLSKKFNREWIFKGIDKTVTTGKPLAISGPNGSGKSTLMLIISGWTLPSAGEITYHDPVDKIHIDQIYRYIDFISPYTELIEELRLDEFLKFHFNFKDLNNGLELDELLQKTQLEGEKYKYVRHFSSGMKQRLKLALGLYSSSPILLLDEPTTNLDKDNKMWYSKEITNVLDKKIVIIASNQPEEYNFAQDLLKIENYK